MRLVFVLLLLCVINNAHCAKILGIFAIPGKSHYILGSSLMRGLAEKGHDVTMISPYEDKNPPKNGSYRDVLVPSITSEQEGEQKRFNLFDIDKLNFVEYSLFMNFFGNDYTEKILASSSVQNLLKSDETFDVVIMEQFVNDAMKAFAHHYKAPLVLFSTFGSNAWINPLVANPAPPSYIPEQNIQFDSSNFCDRLHNAVIYTFGELFRNLVFFPAQNKIMKKYFPDAPDLQEILYNASLVLLNSHLSTNKAVPRVPNMIDIGGFHVKPPKKLPKDLQEYLDNAKEGVIYFSMGSVLQGVNLSIEKREAILKVFSKLKYKVLWKWEDDVLPGQPANVKLGKWLPQQDILAHPNIKAFITHGGLLSTIESVYHGVPLLAIPVYGDQVMNAAQVAGSGCGRYIVYKDLSEKTLEEALHDVLNNPRYRENMKRRSRIMHDRQHSPIDEADYWINYVIRHQGAVHLRVEGLALPWYQYLSLDVAAFVVGTSLLGLYLSYVTGRTILNIMCSRNKSKVKTS